MDGRASMLLFAALVAGCAPPPEIRWLEAPGVDGFRAPEERAELHPATRLWGGLILPEGGGVVEADTGVRPWSGYWYPLSGEASRQAITAALQRYDDLSGRRALEWHRANADSMRHPQLPWEGRCDAWALASILAPPPAAPRNGLSIADQQALRILSFEQLEPGSVRILGLRNDGEGASSFEDLLPMEFHRIILRLLVEERRPFILDRDPRPPVWNTPIWGGRWEVGFEQSRPDRARFVVSTDLYGTLPLEEPGAGPRSRTVVLHYDYRLEAIPAPGGGWKVVDSSWLGASRSDHPDFVTLPDRVLDAGAHHSRNPELDTAILEELLK